jgi:outer membrane receptor protein involved in Fe transport
MCKEIRNSVKKRFTLTILTMAFAFSITSGQDRERLIDLEPFEVRTDGDVGYHSTHAAEVSRMAMPIGDIPMSVTILNQEFIEDVMARSTEDVLEYVPGFIPESNNDNWVIRGFANANTKFMNGFLQQESIGKVSVANVERVEVMRGPAAVLFGQGGYAASVNRVTKRPLERTHTMLRAGYGPQDSLRFEVDHGGPIGKSKFFYRITGVYDDGEYYRRISHDEKAIGGSLRWQMTNRTRLTLETVYVEETDQGAVWRQPMMLGNFKGFTLPDESFVSYGRNRQGYSAPVDIRQWKRGFTMLDFQHAFNRNIALRVQATRDTKDQYYNETQPEQGSLTFLQDAVLMPRRWRIREQDVVNYRSRNELVVTFDTGPARHRILAGFSWDQSDAEVINRESGYNRGGITSPVVVNRGHDLLNPGGHVGSRYNVYPDLTLAEFLTDVRLAGFNPNMIPPINVINPAFSPPVPPREEVDVGLSPTEGLRPTLRVNRNSNDLTINREFYIADMLSFNQDRFFLTGGARRTRTFDRRYDNLTQTNVREAVAHATTYSFGTVYHIRRDQSLTLYANANSSFIPEFRRQPDGEPLPPEEGNQKEFGLRFALREGTIQGMFSIYEIKQQNVAISDPDSDEGEDRYILIDGIRSRGVEFSLNARVSDNLLWFGGYAYTDARDTSDNSRVYAVPYHHITSFLRYTVRLRQRETLDFMLGTIYIGSRPIQPQIIRSLGGGDLGVANAPDWTMPGAWRFDFSTRYRIRRTSGGPRYEVRAKVSNLFDNQDIVKRANRVSLQLQPGRTFQIDFRIRF